MKKKLFAALAASAMLCGIMTAPVSAAMPTGSTVTVSSTDNPLPSEMEYPIDGITPTTFTIVDISSGTSVSIKDLNVSLYKLDDYNRYANRIEKLASWNTTDSESMTFDLPYHFENERSSVAYGVVIENMPEDYVYSSGGKHDGCFPIPFKPITIWTDLDIGNITLEHSYIIEIEKEGTEHHPVTGTNKTATNGFTTTTSPVSGEYVNPRTALYGLAADTAELQMNVGDTHQLSVTWDEDCFNKNSLEFQTDNADIVTVDHKTGLVQAQGDGTAVIKISASLNSKKIQWDGHDSGVRHIEVAVTVTDPALNESQRVALKKLASIEWPAHILDYGRKYPRERAVIRGEIAPDDPRLTLDEVNQIIDSSASFNEVYEKIKAAQKYPDYYAKIEQTGVLYWFNNRGTELITVLPDFEQIYYVRDDENGYPQESQLLYPEKEEPRTVEYSEPDRVFRDFNETYGGTYSPETEPENIPTTTAAKITDIAVIREMLTSYVAEHNLDAKIVSNKEYPGYQDIVVEYNTGAEVNAWKELLQYINAQNIDLTHINVVPLVDGAAMTTSNLTVNPPRETGNVNCTEGVDVADAVLLARFCAEDAEAVITEQGKLNADANSDGELTGDDVIVILRMIAKLI